MTLSFELSPDDLYALSTFHDSHLKQNKKRLFAGRFLGPLVALYVLFQELDSEEPSNLFIGFLAIFSIGWVILYPTLFKKQIERAAKHNAHHIFNQVLLGPTSINLSSTGIHYTRPGAEHDFVWNTIVKQEQTHEHIFLYTSLNSAIIIPKNKIDVDLLELEELLEKYNV